MKKISIVLVVISLFGVTGAISAQNFSLGLKGGLNIPNLTAGGVQNPLNEGYESRLGANYGAFGEYHISKVFSLSLGAEFSSQGGQKDKFQAFVPAGPLAPVAQALGIDYLYADYKSVAKMNYLIVPVLARFSWKLSATRPISFYAAIGPFAGFLLRAHQITSGESIIYADAGKTIPLTPTPQPFDADTDIIDQLNTFNFGLNGYIGFAYRFSDQNSIFLEGGGNYGFIPIQKEADNGKNYSGAGTVSFGIKRRF